MDMPAFPSPSAAHASPFRVAATTAKPTAVGSATSGAKAVVAKGLIRPLDAPHVREVESVARGELPGHTGAGSGWGLGEVGVYEDRTSGGSGGAGGGGKMRHMPMAAADGASESGDGAEAEEEADNLEEEAEEKEEVRGVGCPLGCGLMHACHRDRQLNTVTHLAFHHSAEFHTLRRHLPREVDAASVPIPVDIDYAVFTCGKSGSKRVCICIFCLTAFTSLKKLCEKAHDCHPRIVTVAGIRCTGAPQEKRQSQYAVNDAPKPVAKRRRVNGASAEL